MTTQLSPSAVAVLRRTFVGAVAVQVIGLSFSIALSSVAFGAAGILYAVLVLHDRSIAQRSGLEWFFVAYIAAVVAMVAAAIYPAAALSNARRVLLLAVVYFVAAAIRDERSMLRFLLALVIFSAAQSVLDMVVYYAAAYERLGFFQHYMTSAGMKMFVVLLALPSAISRSTPKRERYALAAAILVVVFALVLTQTRSSWLGLLAGMVFIAAVSARALFAALGVALLLFWFLAPAHMIDRVRNMVSTTQDGSAEAVVTSNQTRVRMWSTGWTMFTERPLLGVGDGEMGKIYRTYVPDALRDEGGHLHSTYVHVLASHGAIGFLAMSALFCAIAAMEWRVWRKSRNRPAAAVALGALAAFIGFAVNGVAEYNFGDHEILVLLWTSVGLASSARLLGRDESRNHTATDT